MAGVSACQNLRGHANRLVRWGPPRQAPSGRQSGSGGEHRARVAGLVKSASAGERQPTGAAGAPADDSAEVAAKRLGKAENGYAPMVIGPAACRPTARARARAPQARTPPNTGSQGGDHAARGSTGGPAERKSCRSAAAASTADSSSRYPSPSSREPALVILGAARARATRQAHARATTTSPPAGTHRVQAARAPPGSAPASPAAAPGESWGALQRRGRRRPPRSRPHQAARARPRRQGLAADLRRAPRPPWRAGAASGGAHQGAGGPFPLCAWLKQGRVLKEEEEEEEF
ncbi:unnamed protein product [Prorocentrum cordatum]|uniref:Uncharacterized protein n=1 Tax=Prorocentrum cordatum TaxID=2364126 RepID=A0ABN9VYK8_9DINO|nr:unnamed protein product [Polarella glacialis]